MTQAVVTILAAIILGALLWNRQRAKMQRAQDLPLRLFENVMPLLEGAELAAGEAVGTWTLTGRYLGHAFQLSVITDTLSVRKLPVLWLMVTLPEALQVSQTFDLMMRVGGPTTFSKFDFLPETLTLPAGFPSDTIIRSDRPGQFPVDAVRPHLAWFLSARGKEILIAPKGLRFVLPAAEASRARYGVLRQADFGDTVLDVDLVKACLDKLLTMREVLSA